MRSTLFQWRWISHPPLRGRVGWGIKPQKNPLCVLPPSPRNLNHITDVEFSILSPQGRGAQAGFSLIEALIATVIIGIAFTGSYSLVIYSEKLMRESLARERLQMQANQILDVIDADSDNIASYVTDLTSCLDPGEEATDAQNRIYEWCQRIEGETGDATSNDTRSISTGTNSDGSTVVYVELTTMDGNVQVVMNRSYGR